MLSAFRRQGLLAVKSGARMRFASTLVDAKDQIYSRKVTFRTEGNTREFTVDAVYQDTHADGGALPVGTIVSMHGSPGSHKDFKFVTPLLTAQGIRVIGVNWPGLGLSEDHPDMVYDNPERTAFLQALIDDLGLRRDVLFLGHSRGCDNTLEIAAKNLDRTIGVVLLTPFALEEYLVGRGIEDARKKIAVYNNNPQLRPQMEEEFYKSYHSVGLRVQTGRIAANCLRTKAALYFGKQQPFIDIINNDGTKRVLFVNAGKDHLIPHEMSLRHAEKYRDRVHLECYTDEPKEEEEITEEMKKAFASGRRAVTVSFPTDNHFVQKHRAKFIAEGITAILKTRQPLTAHI